MSVGSVVVGVGLKVGCILLCRHRQLLVLVAKRLGISLCGCIRLTTNNQHIKQLYLPQPRPPLDCYRNYGLK